MIIKQLENSCLVAQVPKIKIVTLKKSLLLCGFEKYRNIYQNHDSGVYLEFKNLSSFDISAGGIDSDSMKKFLKLEFASGDDISKFGENVVDSVKNMRIMKSDECEPDKDDQKEPEGSEDMGEERCVRKLPSREELNLEIWPNKEKTINSERMITILTWGDKILSKASVKQMGSQYDFNAKTLDGRGKGVDLRKNALKNPKLVLNVASSLSEGKGKVMLCQTLRKIENEDLDAISIFCSKGRHRSVSMALLLKAGYYHNAELKHLTIT